MAVITGGVTGRPAGKLAGVIFGAARSRTGKVVTAREKVRPANPNTAAQQAHRNNFALGIASVRGIGPSEYQEYWNRAVGQLPGFQSLMSILMDVTSETGDLTAPPDTPLGDLHYPETVSVNGSMASGFFAFDWTTENGSNGTPADVPHIYLIPADVTDREANLAVAVSSAGRRDDGTSANITVKPSTDYLAVLLFEGKGTAEGKLSLAHWQIITTVA